MKQTKIKQSQKGFTLIEVLLVIVLIGILISIGLVSFNAEARFIDARNDIRKTHIQTLEGSITQYKLQKGNYPTGLDRNYKEICDPEATDCTGFFDLKQFLVPTYLQAIPQDPNDDNTTEGAGYSVAVDAATNTVSVRALQAEGGEIIAINDPLPAEGTVVTNTLLEADPVIPSGPFTMTIKTDNTSTGSSLSNQFRIPTTGTGYNYNVDWGDGSTSAAQTGPITKTYATAGTYTVKITGTFPRIFFNGGGDRLKLIEINNWGSNVWTSMANAFQGTAMTIKATDAPNLIEVTTTVSMFQSANISGQNLSSWNMSNVTTTDNMFRSANVSDTNLSGWNLSKLTTAGGTAVASNGMFNGATLTSANLSNWTLGSSTVKVINTGYMFSTATNIPDISSWNVSNVTNMVNMFRSANISGQNLSSWNVSNVTNMSIMFFGANLSGSNLSGWNVGNVTNMSGMFQSANISGQNLSSWNMSNVTTTDNMFRSANVSDTNLSGWNLSKLTTAGGTAVASNGMFNGATLTSANLSNWTLGSSTVKVINTGYMFSTATNIPDISSWNVSNVTNMVNMFNGANTFNQNLSGWCVSSILSKPSGFDTGATAWTLSRPIWGTCP